MGQFYLTPDPMAMEELTTPLEEEKESDEDEEMPNKTTKLIPRIVTLRG